MKKLLLTAAVAALALPAAANAQHRGHNPDSDGDKIVTLAEHDAAVAARFAKMDGNGDGQVTQAEMKAAHEARMAERKERMGDRMEQRRAKMEERLAEATPEQRARFEEMKAKRAEMRDMRQDHRGERHEEMWASTDTDGNGAISLAEFQAKARTHFEKMDANDNGQIDPDERRGKRGHRGGGGHRGQR